MEIAVDGGSDFASVVKPEAEKLDAVAQRLAIERVEVDRILAEKIPHQRLWDAMRCAQGGACLSYGFEGVSNSCGIGQSCG